VIPDPDGAETGGITPAPQWKRLAGFIVDDVALLSAAVGVSLWAGVEMSDPPWGLYLLCLLVYYFLFEASCQRTLGKLLTGTRVVSTTGARPTDKQMVLRTLYRLVPFEQFSWRGGSMGHDRWSDTMVVASKAASPAG
jgi:uncharacterized RDD family membrane protein YckC